MRNHPPLLYYRTRKGVGWGSHICFSRVCKKKCGNRSVVLLSLLRVRQTPYDVRTSLVHRSVGQRLRGWVGQRDNQGFRQTWFSQKQFAINTLKIKTERSKGGKTRSAILLVKFMPGCRMDGRERQRGCEWGSNGQMTLSDGRGRKRKRVVTGVFPDFEREKRRKSYCAPPFF